MRDGAPRARAGAPRRGVCASTPRAGRAQGGRRCPAGGSAGRGSPFPTTRTRLGRRAAGAGGATLALGRVPHLPTWPGATLCPAPEPGNVRGSQKRVAHVGRAGQDEVGGRRRVGGEGPEVVSAPPASSGRWGGLGRRGAPKSVPGPGLQARLSGPPAPLL